VCDLVKNVIVISVLIQRLDPFRFELGMAFVEGLRPVLAGRADLFVGRRSLKNGGALTLDDFGKRA
jgi:hypothetical protein